MGDLKDLTRMDMGPPKEFDQAMWRAQEQGGAEGNKYPDGAGGNEDLTRCRFVFDSPVLMVLGFKLLEQKVTGKGGKIVRIKNRFFKEGTLNANPSFPPHIHLNFTLPCLRD